MSSVDNPFYMGILVKDGALGDYGEFVGNELVSVTREMFPLSKKERTHSSAVFPWAASVPAAAD